MAIGHENSEFCQTNDTIIQSRFALCLSTSIFIVLLKQLYSTQRLSIQAKQQSLDQSDNRNAQ